MLTQNIPLGLMAAVLAVLLGQANASEYPTTGYLHGQVEGDLLFYDCDSPKHGEMTCEFDQITVNSGNDSAQFQEELSRIPELTSEFQEIEDSEVCAEDILNKIEDAWNKPPKPDSRFATAGEVEKADMRRRMDALAAVCEEPNEKTVEQLIRVEQDIRARTCSIFLFEYDRNFLRSSENIWIQTGTPGGSCGVIQISRFVKDGIFWDYVFEEKIVNTDATSEVTKNHVRSYKANLGHTI